MRQPSEHSQKLAEEILDHVNYGLSESDKIREWAEVIDEHNRPLLEALSDLIDSADINRGIPDQRYIQKLRALLEQYQPRPERATARDQAQFWPQPGSLAE
jgi:hypothetical protein